MTTSTTYRARVLALLQLAQGRHGIRPLARGLGLPPATVQRWAGGVDTPDPWRLAEVFGLGREEMAAVCFAGEREAAAVIRAAVDQLSGREGIRPRKSGRKAGAGPGPEGGGGGP